MPPPFEASPKEGGEVNSGRRGNFAGSDRLLPCGDSLELYPLRRARPLRRRHGRGAHKNLTQHHRHVPVGENIILSACFRQVSTHVTRSIFLHIIICINAPEGCRHGTHTNGTAYIRGTYSRVHTQTHTNTNKHTTWPDKLRGADSRRGGALLIRGVI
jgi:hypothetical protein